MKVTSWWERGLRCFDVRAPRVLAIELCIFFFVVDCAIEASHMLRLRDIAGLFLEDLVLAGTFLAPLSVRLCSVTHW